MRRSARSSSQTCCDGWKAEMSRRPDRAARARSVSRKFVLQALYQRQLTAHDYTELRNQYATEEGFDTCDTEYFDELLKGVTARADELDERLRTFVDRPLERLDPIERAALW